MTSDEEALCFRDGGQVALSPVVVLEVAIARRFAAFRVAGRIGRIDRLQGVYDCVDAERPQSRVEPDVWVVVPLEFFGLEQLVFRNALRNGVDWLGTPAEFDQYVREASFQMQAIVED